MQKVITLQEWLDEPLQTSAGSLSHSEWAAKVKQIRLDRIKEISDALECHSASVINYAKGKSPLKRIEREAIVKVVKRPMLFKVNGENIIMKP